MTTSHPPPSPDAREKHASTSPALAAAPYLLWPVSRREFYLAIWLTMLLPMLWGVVIYGVRALIMLLASAAAVTFTHSLLKRGLHWRRGRSLVYAHSLAAALLVVALARPAWPIWIVAACALILPLILAVIGGPGRERVHIALGLVLMTQYLFLPILGRPDATYQPEAVLARDRLLMGDIRDQHAAGPGITSWRVSVLEPYVRPARRPLLLWITDGIYNGYRRTQAAVQQLPVARDLDGNDAFPYASPAAVADETLNRVSDILRARAGSPIGAPAFALDPEIRGTLDNAFAYALPPMDAFLLGFNPNRIGAAWLWGIAAAGLFLAYRHILRARSAALFLLTFAAATAVCLFTPATWHAAGSAAIWNVVREAPGAILTLATFLMLNSDIPFAAVFILALPGSEPLTRRGRRYYLIGAAILAAALHRLDPHVPAATLILCLMTPVAPYFDRMLAPRSWLPLPNPQ